MSATNAKSVAAEAARKGKPKAGGGAKVALVPVNEVVTDPSRDVITVAVPGSCKPPLNTHEPSA